MLLVLVPVRKLTYIPEWTKTIDIGIYLYYRDTIYTDTAFEIIINNYKTKKIS